MTKHAVYEVIGNRSYRGHQPGTVFEAALERAAELRAVARGDIRVVRRVMPALPADKWRLPNGWPPTVAPQANTREAPQGASRN